MYRTTIYRLHIKCQSERGIEWIYPANAFCIHRNESRQSKTFIEPGGIVAHANRNAYAVLVSTNEYACLRVYV